MAGKGVKFPITPQFYNSRGSQKESNFTKDLGGPKKDRGI